MHGSQYVTNQSIYGSNYMTNHQLEKDVSCKVFQFIDTIMITKLLGYNVQMQQLLEEKDELWQIISSHNMLLKNICIKLHSLVSTVTALKIIFIYV